MVTGGRCHGPNCTRDATDGPWCDPSCRDAWHAQFHWLYGDGRVQEPVIVRELVEPDGVGEDELPALDAALAATQRQIIESIDFGPAPQPAPVTVAEVARIAASLPRDRPGETVKLTEEQFAALRQALPDRPGWALNTQVNAFDGVTVEIVETVEESTPYLLERRARFKRAAVVAGRGMPWRPAGVPFRVDPEAALTNANAKDPQVTPPNPQVGFIGRAFHWLFGRTG